MKWFNKFRKPYAKEAGDYISCDMGVFLNCPSCEGYLYTDHASKYSWLYGLKNKDQAINFLQHSVKVRLPALGIKMRHYHADGTGESVGKSTLVNLNRNHITYLWLPPDTPKFNGISERKSRTHNEVTLCMLTRANMHRSF
jgi:hypothetical protein